MPRASIPEAEHQNLCNLRNLWFLKKINQFFSCIVKIVLAFDSFKGSLSAVRAVRRRRRDWRASRRAAGGVLPALRRRRGICGGLVPGGTGRDAQGADHRSTRRPDSCQTRSARRGAYRGDRSGAGVRADLVPRTRRNPLFTTTYGVGEMLRAAASTGARRLLVGIGGSSTNDGGMGMLSALGWRFLDVTGNEVQPIGMMLELVRRIEAGDSLPNCDITVACDVTDPLFGHMAPPILSRRRKGRLPKTSPCSMTACAIMPRCAPMPLAQTFLPCPAPAPPAASVSPCSPSCMRNTAPAPRLAISLSGLEAHLSDADLCLTGEGCTNAQTAFGKLPAAVAACCRRAGVPCVCSPARWATAGASSRRRRLHRPLLPRPAPAIAENGTGRNPGRIGRRGGSGHASI